jgi:hypothetical protein
VSHGLFSAGKINFSMAPCQVPQESPTDQASAKQLSTEESNEELLQLTSDIWLAPFDFGIMQKVAVAFCRSVEDPGFLEIRILLERLSGEANAWRRINKAFLHELRKTLLMWRSLDATSKAYYEEMIIADGRKRGIDIEQQIESTPDNAISLAETS